MAEAACRQFLVCPPDADPATAAACLAAAIDAGDIASLLLPASRELVSALLPVAQDCDVAVLIADDVRIAAYTKADGVHVTRGAAALRDARKSLGSRSIVGALSPNSRHTAMEIGEAGADYIGFDISAPEGVDMVGWWSELFEVPCVAFGAGDEDQAAAALAARADFIEPPSAMWHGPVEAAARVARLQEMIAEMTS